MKFLNVECFMSHSFFFFQAEDAIRDGHVTGVQTCALPIARDGRLVRVPAAAVCAGPLSIRPHDAQRQEACDAEAKDLAARRAGAARMPWRQERVAGIEPA